MKTRPIRENSIRNKRHVSYIALISDHAVLFGDIYIVRSAETKLRT